MCTVFCKSIECRYNSKDTKTGINCLGIQVKSHYCILDSITIVNDIFNNKDGNITQCISYKR